VIFRSVCVLVAHYGFDGFDKLERDGNKHDVEAIRETFTVKREGKFVELASPTRDDLLENLRDEQKLFTQFGVDKSIIQNILVV